MRSPVRGRVEADVSRVSDLGRRARHVLGEAMHLHDLGLAARARAWRARDRRVPATTLVGGDGELWHDDDDRVQFVRALDRGFADLRTDVEIRASSIHASAATRQWWSVEVLPALTEWHAFVSRAEASWARRAATEWSTYDEWLDRLRDLRSAARAHGMVLSTPEPPDLPKTIYQRAAEGRGSTGETWWTLGRVVLYTALGIGLLSLGDLRADPTPTQGPRGR